MSKPTEEPQAVLDTQTETVSETSTDTSENSQTTAPKKTTASKRRTKSNNGSAQNTSQQQVSDNGETAVSSEQDNTMSQNTIRRVAIIGGNRIPFARSNGQYFTASNSDMFTAALNGLVERFNLKGQRLGEVVAGAVLKHSRDFNMTRECVLNTQLAPETPAYDIQQACGTGLQAAFLVANKIALGQIGRAHV